MDNKIYELPLESIELDTNQPRHFLDEQALRELSESIEEYGLIQPIVVRPNGDGSFKVITGERRFRAHKKAGLPTIQCIIRELSDPEVENAQLEENIHRKDLTDLELAHAFQKRVDAGQTHEEIAKAIKKSRAYVTQRLTLLKLPEETQKQLENGKITFAEARTLVGRKQLNPEVQHSYTVTIEELEVHKLFIGAKEDPSLNVLYDAYRKDLVTIRKAVGRVEA